ncbi:MAG TPA: DUF2309 domain-containing protein, partial [Abditibacteriaceae bacterium]
MTLTLEHPQIAEANFVVAPLEMEPVPPSLAEQIDAACARVPPLWPLKNFVAVNPFVGLSSEHFLDASALVRRVAHGDMMMPLSYYRQQWEAGHIAESDLRSALELAQQGLPEGHFKSLQNISVETLKTALHGTQEHEPSVILTVADWLDALNGTQWSAFLVDEISKWCSAFYDEGQASWRMPWRGESLFAAWKQAALRDANPEMMGLRAFRSFVATLPDDATETVEYALHVLQVPSESTVDFLHRQLMSISGWSGYVQYQVREKGLYGKHDDSLQGLLAIRLAYEAALFKGHNAPEQAASWTQNVAVQGANSGVATELLTNYLWQLAAEAAYQRGLMQSLQVVTVPEVSARPAAQGVFCIDVRSEVFRRSLEAASPDIETLGFAGFFGFPIEVIPFGARHGSAQCPVLLTPKFRIRESISGASHGAIESALHGQQFSKRLGRGWNSFKTSAVSCFAFVETGGLLSGVKIVKDSLGMPHHKSSGDVLSPCVQHEAAPPSQHGHEHAHLHGSGMTTEEQIAVAANAMKHMGLKQFARLVMICGHGSSTTNNPYGSGLDCGACGGHTGEANARVAAAVFNNPEVRSGLQAQGVIIPEDTHFVSALHNTTTDDVTLFDEHLIPATHRGDLLQLNKYLQQASHQTRLLRAPSLGLADAPQDEVDALVRARSLDWAQTRPEWGLAGNAAFIAAPRARTRQLNLGGRSFLNNYDYASDEDGSRLELVMTAPMVVASWINLQYFASTVNNRDFGSGNKTIHNVVGTVGVWQGNCGDLQVGLPLQSVHDGNKWMHEPLRLSVFIEAPRAAINSVI